jgi:hypothetical protein
LSKIRYIPVLNVAKRLNWISRVLLNWGGFIICRTTKREQEIHLQLPYTKINTKKKITMIPITKESYTIKKQGQINQWVLYQERNKSNKLLPLNTIPPILYHSPVIQIIPNILAINLCILVVTIKKNNWLIFVLLVTDLYAHNVLFMVYIKNTKYKQQERR